MDPSLQLIFFAHPRCGGSSLFQILQLHPALHLLEEPFNENFTRWSPENPNYRDRIHDRASLDEQLAIIFASYNGLKVLDYQLPDNLIVPLLHRPGCRVLFLHRRNLLQAVVSVLIAGQTALWKKWEMTRPLEEYYRDLLPLDVDDVQRRVAELHQHLEFCESVIDTRPAPPALKLVYEDLYFTSAEHRSEQMTHLWSWLGIAPLESERVQYYLDPGGVKINSAVTYAWLPNADEIEKRCGNDITGRLFATP